MIVVSFFIWPLIIIILASDLLLIVSWLFNFKSYQRHVTEFPKVSILVAARNEASTIKECLQKLIQLDYPKNKIEILVGNDNSEDQTYQIAQELADKHREIKVFDINENLGLARGKANVLAHLANKAQGDFYFITDADTRVPKQWVKQLLGGIHENVGIVSGVTVVGGETLFARLQNMEWLNALGMLKVVTDFGVPVTGVGNNMVVVKTAYDQVGGYEKIPFSIVEDFQLTRAVVQAHFKVINLVGEKVKATTRAATTAKDIFNQRKRWMFGAFKVPFILKIILLAQALTMPLIFFLVVLNLKLAMIFLALKIIFRFTFTIIIYKKVNHKINIDTLLIYDLYAGLLTIFTLIYFMIPSKVDWKGRKY